MDPKLEQAILQAASLLARYRAALVEAGFAPDEAMQLVREYQVIVFARQAPTADVPKAVETFLRRLLAPPSAGGGGGD